MASSRPPKPYITLRKGEKRCAVPASTGEKFSTLEAASHAYFRHLGQNCRIYLLGNPVDRETIIESRHLGKEMELREVKPVEIKLPYGLNRQIVLEVTEKIEKIAEEVCKMTNLEEDLLSFLQENSQLDLSKPISTLTTALITVKIRISLPTIYLIEQNKVKFSFPRSYNMTETSIRNYLRWKTGQNDQDLRLICEGKQLKTLPDHNALFIMYLYRKQEVTLVVRRAQGSGFGLDLPVNSSLNVLFTSVAEKTGSEIDHIRLVYRGKQMPKQGNLADFGLTDGSIIWLIVQNGKLPVIIRLPNQLLTLDHSPTDTISVLKASLSHTTSTTIEKLQLLLNNTLLSDEEKLPNICFGGLATLELRILPTIYIRCLSGKLTRMVLPEGITVGDLQAKLHGLKVTTSRNCKLSIGKQDLDPTLSLSTAGLRDKAVIHADSL